MRNLFIISSVCIMMGWGCTPSLELQSRSISLSASVGNVTADNCLQVKADGTPVTANPFTGIPTDENPLNAALWFSDQIGSYSHNPQAPTFLPCTTSVSYTATTPKDIRTDDGSLLQYPISENEGQAAPVVYCVGFYPDSGWGDPGVFASHEINGSEDLMFSDQMAGSYTDNFKPQEYAHLLTWIKVNLSVTSLGAANIWGDVKRLELISPNSNVSVSFSSEVGMSSVVSYNGGAKSYPMELPVPSSLSITTRTFGQVFCAPPVKNDEGYFGYTVVVETENLPEKEVFIKLVQADNITPVESADYAVGKLFVMNLRFNDIAIVEGVCTLRQWDDQNSDIYLK